tara:strand:- start:357 stop:590 length:234 start_codon:yes stop_codon:yes gene_type:complete
VDQTERIEKLMEVELEYYFDKNPKRIFLGGITNGASIALATYLRYNREKPLGGVMSLYGINPIQDVSKFTSDVAKYS